MFLTFRLEVQGQTDCLQFSSKSIVSHIRDVMLHVLGLWLYNYTIQVNQIKNRFVGDAEKTSVIPQNVTLITNAEGLPLQ